MTDERPPDEEPKHELAEADDAPFTTADFHNVTQKQILNAVYETLVETKLAWETVAPFLETAREIARSDFEAADVRLHTLREEDGKWVDAEEAFLGISVADREDGAEWLSETWWVSELAIAHGDPEKVRAIVSGLERSLDRINAWLAQQEGDAEAPPS